MKSLYLSFFSILQQNKQKAISQSCKATKGFYPNKYFEILSLTFGGNGLVTRHFGPHSFKFLRHGWYYRLAEFFFFFATEIRRSCCICFVFHLHAKRKSSVAKALYKQTTLNKWYKNSIAKRRENRKIEISIKTQLLKGEKIEK